MTAKVDEFISKHNNFSEELTVLRSLMLSTGLVEAVKWGMPTYTLNGKNVAGLGAFKAHYGIWFFQGGLLKDDHRVLINAQEGKTQAMRQWRFTKDSKIDRQLVLAYINQAIENEQKGLRIKIDRTKKPLIIPAELESLFKDNKTLAQAFNALTLTNKRDFSEYISEAKREDTKARRLEKIIPMILNNIGLNDKYKNC